jgi:hypothetical protein
MQPEQIVCVVVLERESEHLLQVAFDADVVFQYEQRPSRLCASLPERAMRKEASQFASAEIHSILEPMAQFAIINGVRIRGDALDGIEECPVQFLGRELAFERGTPVRCAPQRNDTNVDQLCEIRSTGD